MYEAQGRHWGVGGEPGSPGVGGLLGEANKYTGSSLVLPFAYRLLDKSNEDLVGRMNARDLYRGASHPVFFFFTFLFYIGVQLINNVEIISGGQQSDSAIHIHVSVLPQTPLPSRLPHNIEQSSLCSTVSPR